MRFDRGSRTDLSLRCGGERDDRIRKAVARALEGIGVSTRCDDADGAHDILGSAR